MRRILWLPALLLLITPELVRGSELTGAAVEDIIAVLHERGLIDDDERTGLIAKHRAETERLTAKGDGPLAGWEWSGDLRLRYEGFYYDSDDRGVERDNRNRFRYRARLGVQKQVHPRVRVGVRLASGQGSARSSNRTLGNAGDFDPDDLFIDRVWADLLLGRSGTLETRLLLGKLENPFRWRNGWDGLIWDGDVTPEGAALIADWPLSEESRLFGRLGAFIADENSDTKDPKVFALQLGGTSRLRGGTELGLRASGYEWRSLDELFIEDPSPSDDSAVELGNLRSAFDGRARIAELSGFVRFSPRERWPGLLYGTWVRNFTADSAVIGGFDLDSEDTAWGVGLEVGRASALAKLGLGFFHIEANAVVAPFTDSDLFDGRTNRRGWMFYVSRDLVEGVSLKLEYLDSDSIENTGGGAGPFAESIEHADRKRLRTDLVIVF